VGRAVSGVLPVLEGTSLTSVHSMAFTQSERMDLSVLPCPTAAGPHPPGTSVGRWASSSCSLRVPWTRLPRPAPLFRRSRLGLSSGGGDASVPTTSAALRTRCTTHSGALVAPGARLPPLSGSCAVSTARTREGTAGWLWRGAGAPGRRPREDPWLPPDAGWGRGCAAPEIGGAPARCASGCGRAGGGCSFVRAGCARVRAAVTVHATGRAAREPRHAGGRGSGPHGEG
jgi:hypothetical protein